jgi:isopropylmalate/homocitrate/citramalate synthase
MSDDPEVDRVARLIAELNELPFEEREAAIAKLSETDREAVWATELEQSESVLPEDEDELGGEG